MTSKMQFRCPNTRCRKYIVVERKLHQSNLVCPHCDYRFEKHQEIVAAPDSIFCHHPLCSVRHPIKVGTEEEALLFRVMPLGGGSKQYFCAPKCHQRYRQYLKKRAIGKSDVDIENDEAVEDQAEAEAGQEEALEA